MVILALVAAAAVAAGAGARARACHAAILPVITEGLHVTLPAVPALDLALKTPDHNQISGVP